MLHSWADSKKKSNLVLTTFFPGENNISWLGNMQKLGPAAELDSNPYQTSDNDESETTPFPVLPSQRRSYNSQANVVWIKPSGLQVWEMWQLVCRKRWLGQWRQKYVCICMDVSVLSCPRFFRQTKTWNCRGLQLSSMVGCKSEESAAFPLFWYP